MILCSSCSGGGGGSSALPSDPSGNTVATPVISPASGNVASGTTATITCTTSGATIRYTFDGNDPAESSSEYTSPVAIVTGTLKAKAFKSGMTSSETASAAYTLTDGVAVTFSVSNPSYQAITFSSSDVSITAGKTLTIISSNSSISSASNWCWYVDNVQDTAQTASSFSWDTAGKDLGQYIINVEATLSGIRYSGSLRVTVTE